MKELRVGPRKGLLTELLKEEALCHVGTKVELERKSNTENGEGGIGSG